MKLIKIATDYSDTPLGRYPEDGRFNGERFREDFLVPALRNNDLVTIDLDDVEGYGSSFLEESFGGLVREGHFTAQDLRRKLQIKFSDPVLDIYKVLIWKYIAEAQKR
jgi:hypothetical protein